MASVYYGQNRGQDTANPSIVLESGSTNSTDVEVRIDTGKGTTRDEVLQMVTNIMNAILDGRNTAYPYL